MLQIDKARAARIAALNDSLRITFSGGRVTQTPSIAALPSETRSKVLETVHYFKDFNETNDAFHEHDCAVFEVDGEAYMFKIDCYDLDMKCESPDPTDPTQTLRILTIMMATEY